jgi:hypothetical protein
VTASQVLHCQPGVAAAVSEVGDVSDEDLIRPPADARWGSGSGRG